ncbi:MAG: glycosyltransferase family A protein, partial [Peptostreptococcaceae bacterium]|nr:glycosyltransferase family A protein [Peptostreptococcaceae bacterium]
MKVSIIIAAYNIEDYINRCLNSIVNQSFKDIEIIVVNDGSTDNTINIINNFAKNDVRIKVIDKKNGGLIEARKSGLARASGEYILFLDGDDWLHIEAIEKLY